MGKIVFVAKEVTKGEPRVAVTPETARKLVNLGFTVFVERSAGLASRIVDQEFVDAGAECVDAKAIDQADIILKVRRPAPSELKNVKKGAILIGMLDPYGHEAEIEAIAKAGITAFAMELLPRITRAQVMDVLSSQANLAGYQAVIDAAATFDRALPMMMTAAGTVPAAKVFIMGAGVAGLQAIATARRLGAIVTANDVRPAAKEQVESLGAKFIAVEDDEFKAAETAGGYAKEMSMAYQEKQAALTSAHLSKQDIVITTALIPGKQAPVLITKTMLKTMRSGSVVVDLAVERGGNVEGSVADQVVDVDGVTVVGYTNVAGRIAATASQLYARNLYAFLEGLTDKANKTLAINDDDELVQATLITRDGRVVNEKFVANAGRGSKKGSRPTASPATARDVKAESEPTPKTRNEDAELTQGEGQSNVQSTTSSSQAKEQSPVSLEKTNVDEARVATANDQKKTDDHIGAK